MELKLEFIRSRLFQAVLLLAAITAVHADAEPADSPDVLRFIRNAKAVYVFPVISPAEPRRNDKLLRLLGPKARHSLVQLLGEERNWYRGLYTVIVPLHQPINVGFVFRNGKDELVLFFSSGPAGPIKGTFHGGPIEGMLEDEPEARMENWKRRYAQPELSAK